MEKVSRLHMARYHILLLFLLLAISPQTDAQEAATYSLSFEQQPLKEILQEISNQTGYKFAYSDTEIPVEREASFAFREKTLPEMLADLCRLYGMESEVIGRTVVLTGSAGSRSVTIHGRVTDMQDGRALEWVNVTSADMRHGTMTDASGAYQLEINSVPGRVRFSSMGYRSQIVTITTDSVLDIAMEKDIRAIEEIVVVAFGKEDRDLITGAVSVIEPELFSQLNNASVNSALQTTATGLLVQNNAGTPGSTINVTIRGLSSITAGNRPLYILDGIPMIGGNFSQLDFSGQTIDALSDLNVHDIESISILKDAASASLYGASAANGVVLINTKQGRGRQNQVHVDTYYGLQQTTGKLDMLNAAQWMNLVNEESVLRGEGQVYTDSAISNNTVDTDWLDQVFRTAPVYNFYLSFRGSTENSSYYLSGDYFNQEGIVIGSDLSRYSFRANYDYRFSERLTFEAGNGFSYALNNRVEGDQSLNGPLPVGISMPPVYPVRNPDGSYNNDGPYANPVSIANEEKNLATTYRNMFNFAVNYELSEQFRIRTQTGLDYYHLGEQTFAPKTTRQGGKYNGLGIEATNNALLLYNSTLFNYDLSAGMHNLSLMGGFSYDRYRSHGTFLRAQNFPGSSFEFLQDAANPIIASSSEIDAVSNSVFGSARYDFAERYIVSMTMRRDGSSKFGEKNRFGYFPSVSGLWYVSNEDFWDPAAKMNKLKVRASYGLTGNDQITDFIALDLFSAGANYNYNAGIQPYQLSNPGLKWETTAQLNTGVELGIADRVSLSADYYLKRTWDLLLEVPIPTSTGFNYFISNVGKIQNQGVEIEAGADVLRGTVKWRTSISVTSNQNKVLQLYQDQPIRNIGRANSSIEVGEPVSYFYGFVAEGVDPETGLLIYKDIHKDGVINDLDRTRIGSPFPTAYGGWMNTLSCKGFQLDFLFYFSQGNSIFNSTRLYTETISIGNQTTAVLDRWKSEGDKATVPNGASYNERISSRFVEDGSFIRLRNIKLSYDLNQRVLDLFGMDQLQVYLAGRNLLTITGYSGMDPEVNYTTTSSIKLGTDFFTCPQPKSIIIGICAKF